MRLFIKKTGKGYPLVLFHGWAFTHAVWQSLADKLADSFTLYCVDLPGFGQSDLLDWPDFKKKLCRLLPESFAVLGWSLGGLYAMRLACETPQVSHLISIASSPCFLQKDTWPGVQPETLMQFYQNIRQNPVKTIKAFIQLQQGKQPVDRRLLSYDAEALGLLQGLKDLNAWDLRSALSQYDHPACFIFGRLDAITPAKTMTAMQQDYPHFQYHLISKAAHIPFLSHLDDCSKILQEFLI